MKKRKSGSKEGKGGGSPSQRIDARIKELNDWRGATLARVRILIKQADRSPGANRLSEEPLFGWAKMRQRLRGVVGSLARRKGG